MRTPTGQATYQARHKALLAWFSETIERLIALSSDADEARRILDHHLPPGLTFEARVAWFKSVLVSSKLVARGDIADVATEPPGADKMRRGDYEDKMIRPGEDKHGA